MNSDRAINYLCLSVILLIAVAMRAPHVSQPLVDWFTWREASTAMMAENLPRNGWNPFWPEVNWTGDQPGYQGREFQVLTFASAALDQVLGWRDWHGRLAAAAFGLLTTLGLYNLVFRLRGARMAAAGALVYAIVPGAVAIDTSYLPDPAMVAIATIALWLLVKGLQENRPGILLGASLLGILAMLAKLPSLSALPAAIYLVWALPDPHGRRRRLALMGVWLCAATVVVGAYYSWAVYLGRTYPPFHIAGQGFLWSDGLADFIANGFYIKPAFATANSWLYGWTVLVLGVVGLFSLPAATSPGDAIRSHAPAPWFFHVWLAGYALFFLMAAREVVEQPWNFHVASPAVAALAGMALVRICSLESGKPGLRSMACAAGLVALVAANSILGVKQVKQTHLATADHDLGQALAQLAAPNDLVIVSGNPAGNPVGIYYSRHRGWIFPLPEYFITYMDDDERAVSVLEDLVGRGAKWFGVVKNAADFSVPPKKFIDHHAALLARLSATYTLQAETENYLIYKLSKR